MRRRFWLVELTNNTDRRDDEVWKVRASSKHSALVLAGHASPSRFTLGRVVPVRGGSRAVRALAREFRTYCTRTL